MIEYSDSNRVSLYPYNNRVAASSPPPATPKKGYFTRKSSYGELP